MSSQEEYLDQLLKGLSSSEDIVADTLPESDSKPNKVFVDNQLSQDEIVTPEPMEDEVTESSMDLSSLMEELLGSDNDSAEEFDFVSVNDVESAIKQTKEEATQAIQQSDFEEQDLFELLQQDGDSEAMAIRELLQKDENNEAVSADILELLQGGPQEPMTLEDLDAMSAEEVPVISDKQQKAAQRNAIRDLRNSRKREKQELKRQERLARREEKNAKKMTSARAAKQQEEMQPDQPVYQEMQSVSQPETAGADELFGLFETTDMAQLQSIDESLYGEVTPTMEAPSLQPEDQMAADALFQELTNDQSMMDLFTMTDEEALISAGTEEGRAASTYNVVGQDNAPKKSIFSRFWDFLTEEDEEEEETRGNENISMSNENQAILKEMDAEGKKKKKKKGEEEKEEGKEDGKEEKKPKKQKKPKKEKKPQPVEEPSKKLSKKKVSVVALLGVSTCALIMVIASILSDYSIKKDARAAYYAQDYQTCYQNLFGKELNESEQVMFHRSEMILKIRLWIREYEILAEEGSEVEALDSLIQSVHEYPELLAYSNQWNAGSDVEAVYKELLSILNGKYHLSEEDAEAIANIKSDVEYTRAVTAIVEGSSYAQWEEQSSSGQKVEQENIPVEKLPEEDELGNDIHFIDNIG